MRLALNAVILTCMTAPLTSWAANSVMARQAVKGTLLVVSPLERAGYEDLLGRMYPKFVVWTGATAERSSVTLPAGPVSLTLFLLTSLPQLVRLDPSWHESLPMNAADLSYKGVLTAAKVVTIPGQREPSVSMVILAPNEQLLKSAFEEALAYERFPLTKPVTRDVADLRHVRSIACLPSAAPREMAPVGEAAEAALYSELTGVRLFQVVGREALPLGATGALSADQLRKLGDSVHVQAVAAVQLTDGATVCKEHTEYQQTTRKSVSDDRQQEWDDAVERLKIAGKTVPKRGPEADLVWAAPFLVRQYVTTVTGDLKVVDVATGTSLLSYKLDGTVEGEAESEEPRTYDYRWYKIDDINDWDARDEDEYPVMLRSVEATQIVRRQVTGFGKLLAARAILPAASELLGTQPDTPQGAVSLGKILEVEGLAVYLNVGRDVGVQLGDQFAVWGEKQLKDPDTGDVIETVRTRLADLKVVELFEKTCRCELPQGGTTASLQPGMAVSRP